MTAKHVFRPATIRGSMAAVTDSGDLDGECYYLLIQVMRTSNRQKLLVLFRSLDRILLFLETILVNFEAFEARSWHYSKVSERIL